MVSSSLALTSPFIIAQAVLWGSVMLSLDELIMEPAQEITACFGYIMILSKYYYSELNMA